MIKRVIWVGLDEKEDQAQNDWVHSKHWFPVSAQDVEADVAICVDVGMVDGCVAVDLGGFMGVVEGDVYSEFILATLP